MAWFCTVNSLLNDIVGILVFHHNEESTRGGDEGEGEMSEKVERKDQWGREKGGRRGRNKNKWSGMKERGRGGGEK